MSLTTEPNQQPAPSPPPCMPEDLHLRLDRVQTALARMERRHQPRAQAQEWIGAGSVERRRPSDE